MLVHATPTLSKSVTFIIDLFDTANLIIHRTGSTAVLIFPLSKLIDFHDLADRLSVLPALHLKAHMGLKVILEDQILNPRERLLNGTCLCDDVNTILLSIDHALKPFHLPRNNAKPPQRCFFNICFHAASIPPGGI